MADERVESSLAMRGLGLGSDAASIETLQLRQAAFEKINRPKPKQSFAEILNGQKKPSLAKPENKLPRKGPKPKLVHPKLSQVFGREEDEVVLKG